MCEILKRNQFQAFFPRYRKIHNWIKETSIVSESKDRIWQCFVRGWMVGADTKCQYLYFPGVLYTVYIEGFVRYRMLFLIQFLSVGCNERCIGMAIGSGASPGIFTLTSARTAKRNQDQLLSIFCLFCPLRLHECRCALFSFIFCVSFAHLLLISPCLSVSRFYLSLDLIFLTVFPISCFFVLLSAHC